MTRLVDDLAVVLRMVYEVIEDRSDGEEAALGRLAALVSSDEAGARIAGVDTVEARRRIDVFGNLPGMRAERLCDAFDLLEGTRILDLSPNPLIVSTCGCGLGDGEPCAHTATLLDWLKTTGYRGAVATVEDLDELQTFDAAAMAEIGWFRKPRRSRIENLDADGNVIPATKISDLIDELHPRPTEETSDE